MTKVKVNDWIGLDISFPETTDIMELQANLELINKISKAANVVGLPLKERNFKGKNGWTKEETDFIFSERKNKDLSWSEIRESMTKKFNKERTTEATQAQYYKTLRLQKKKNGGK